MPQHQHIYLRHENGDPILWRDSQGKIVADVESYPQIAREYIELHQKYIKAQELALYGLSGKELHGYMRVPAGSDADQAGMVLVDAGIYELHPKSTETGSGLRWYRKIRPAPEQLEG